MHVCEYVHEGMLGDVDKYVCRYVGREDGRYAGRHLQELSVMSAPGHREVRRPGSESVFVGNLSGVRIVRS